MNDGKLKSVFLKMIVLVAASAGIAAGAMAQSVTGAGASFPAPVYAQWADAYNKATGVRINYQSIGSSAGINQIRNKTVDFGASDAPLTEEQLKEAGLIQFPMVIGGVVPVVNIQGVKPGELKLNGLVIADIYLGKIVRWNDPAVKKMNPGVNLPDAPISVVRRSDGSGTSFAFTSFLSQVSDEWRQKVGAGTAVNWPVGAGGKGNEGVSAFVMQLPNSIGYVEYAYAKQNTMSHVLLQNASGKFSAPNEETFKASASGIDWNRSFGQSLIYTKNEKAWPISTATFILLYRQTDKPEQARQALKFFDWAYANGDAAARQLDYVPFPESVKNIVRKSWKSIVDAQGNAVLN
ncbi:MAG: phosphate ABC transporter substrate-binding protein PstS [Candidatus Accumulibacter sp.]|jgi:phosphate transport system substrate-binding protein|nr:phosphate ABC transporter substrate-binding protein PstS [Accumulibacter sp.]